jgi:hypothetical protein
VWGLVERAEIAARPGLVWRVVRDLAGDGAPDGIKTDVVDEPHELAWTALLSLDGGTGEATEVRWSFRLAPNWTGTEVEHGARVERVPTPSEQLDLKRRMVATLANVKGRAEISS